MHILNRCSPLLRNTTLLVLMLPALAYAHPGHGLGPVGHDLQHMAWNFIGMTVLAALLLAGDRLFSAVLQRIKVRKTMRSKPKAAKVSVKD